MYNVQRRFISLLFVVLSISLFAENISADRELFDAYLREDMSVWKAYVDTVHHTPYTLHYEYGYCGYIVAEAKKEGQEALLPPSSIRSAALRTTWWSSSSSSWSGTR